MCPGLTNPRAPQPPREEALTQGVLNAQFRSHPGLELCFGEFRALHAPPVPAEIREGSDTHTEGDQGTGTSLRTSLPEENRNPHGPSRAPSPGCSWGAHRGSSRNRDLSPVGFRPCPCCGVSTPAGHGMSSPSKRPGLYSGPPHLLCDSSALPWNWEFLRSPLLLQFSLPAVFMC